MDYRNELDNLRKKTIRKQHLKSDIKILQDRYSEGAVKLGNLKKKKKLIAEYEKALVEYEAVKNELKKKEDELLGLKDCEMQYEIAFLKAVERAKQIGGETKVKLEELEVSLKQLEKRKKEITNVYSEGYSAFDLGRDVVKRLEKAKKWGLADLFGGGIFAAREKYDYIYEAQGYLVEFKLQLSRFQDIFNERKISDEELRVDFSVQGMESMLIDHIGNDISDMPFELGNDLHTQRMILDTRNKVVAICGQLKEILGELKIVVQNAKMSYNEAINEIVDYIVNTK